jgi:hypothetical protein
MSVTSFLNAYPVLTLVRDSELGSGSSALYAFTLVIRSLYSHVISVRCNILYTISIRSELLPLLPRKPITPIRSCQ